MREIVNFVGDVWEVDAIISGFPKLGRDTEEWIFGIGVFLEVRESISWFLSKGLR